MNLYVAEDMGKGSAYVAPDSHFISLVSLLSKNLPWKKFGKFFETKQLVNLNAEEHLILLRLLAMQELLCLNDKQLLNWGKHQLFLLSFMQPGIQPKLPVNELLIEFRSKLDNLGLLKPFRRQCQKLIKDHSERFPPLTAHDGSEVHFSSAKNQKQMSDPHADLYDVKNESGVACTSCGSQNVIMLTPSQEASSLPDISFSRCRFCGNTFRNNH